jgi:hypothetical protein
MKTITEPFEAVAVETDPLDIVVPYTTAELTRLALMKAAELSLEVPSRIRIIRVQRVPFPLQLQDPPVAVGVLREQTEKVARGLRAAEIDIILARDAEETLLKAVTPNSIIVIAGYKRRWPTHEERLKKFFEHNGCRVAMIHIK